LHREWERKEKARAELARRIKEEEARLGDLEAKATNWVKAMRIRAFVTAFEKGCRAKDAPTTPESPDGQWIAWARQQANRFDPLVESPPSVLDRNRESPSG
jgi:hypothetical protein